MRKSALVMIGGLGLFFALLSSASVGQDGAANQQVEIRQQWKGLFPVAKLDALPEGQRAVRVGYIADAKTFEAVWKAFKPDAEVPKVDFTKELAVFVRNTRFVNAISVDSAVLADGTLVPVAIETRTAKPITDHVFMAIVVVPREGVKAIRTGRDVIQVDGAAAPKPGVGASKPAGGEDLVITNADNGKTLTARIGQTVRVELVGERANTGWETGFTPSVIERIKPDADAQKRIGGPTKLNDFKPAKDAANPAAGTYVFLYRATREGEQALRFVYVSPGGPIARPRLATQLVAEFKATVKVVAAPPASQLDEFTFGQPTDGLRLGLKAEQNRALAVPLTGRVVLQNVSDKPVLVLSLLTGGATVFFNLTAPDGAAVPYRGKVLDWDVPDYDKAVKELKPNEFISGTLVVTGFTFAQEGEYTLTARYVWRNARPPQGRQPAEWNRGPIWTGEVKSAPVTVTKPTAGAAGLPATEPRGSVVLPAGPPKSGGAKQ